MIPTTIRFGSRSSDVARWQAILGVVADGAFGHVTAAATRSWQAARGLTVDGVVGPMTWAIALATSPTKEPAMHQTITADEFIIGGRAVKAPEGLEVLNWTNGGTAVPRLVSGGTRTQVTELILHETCDNPGAADTLATLKKRGLSVALIVDAFGRVTQHADLLSDVTQHAGSHNGRSIGIEVDNPYYPSWNRRPDVWPDVIPAPWAHAETGKRGRYVVPTLASMETTCTLTRWLTSEEAPVGISITRNWIGRRGTKFALGLVSGAEKPAPGIYAHHYFAHADAACLALYCFLRIELGFAPVEARGEVIRLATGAVGAVTLPEART